VATISVPGTGDWNDYIDISAEVSGLTGKHDLYLYFSGGGDYLFNIDSFRFTGGTVPTPTPAGKIGDLNGDDSVDSTDITLMKRYLLRKISDFPVDDELYAADVNGDDEINSTDLTLLKRYVLRKIDKFPKQ
jgi:glucuronoarabinoxylan endo-1,4-beta-xylanase